MKGDRFTGWKSTPLRRIGRWLGRGALAAIVALLLLTSPMACTTMVVPPAKVEQPVDVVLLDHGRHASLALPNGAGGMSRYAYGDWAWYARNDTGAWSAVRAVLLPSQAGLGREKLPAGVTPDRLAYHLVVGIEHQWTLTVERAQADALRVELDQAFEDHAATAVENPRFGLRFVHHPDAYSYFHNSNHMVAGWLRRLGCEARGPAFASAWRVESSATDD